MISTKILYRFGVILKNVFEIFRLWKMTTIDKLRLKYCLVCNKRLDLIPKRNMRPIKKSNDVFLKFSTIINFVTTIYKKIIF